MKSLKKNTKSKSSILITILTSLLLLVSLFTNENILHAEDDYSKYWTKTNESGEDVYTAIASANNQEYGQDTQFVVSPFCSNNAYEASFRANSEAYNLNVGMHVITSTHNYFFDYRQDCNALRFRIDTNWIAYSEHISATVTEWFTLKMVFDDGIVKCYANGVLKYSIANDTIALDATNKFTISTWSTNSSFKNAKSYDEEMEYGFDIPSSWVSSIEEDETVYTLTNSTMSSFSNQAKNNGTYNTFEFDFRMNTITSTYDCNIGATVQVGANSFFFEYNPAENRKYFRLRYFPSGSQEGEGISIEDIDISPLSSWNHMKIVFAEGYLAGYLNDKLAVFGSETHGEDLSKAIVGISTWNASPSVKNFKTSLSTIDYSAVGYVDLEFKDNRAVEAFTTSNANLSYNDGQLIANFNGANPKLISPTIKASKGRLYSANLNVRNTFLVRLKNNSSSDRVKVYFKTKLDDEYYSKEFDIKPYSDYESYFFNISDVFDCGEWHTSEALKKCNHYLSDFTFEFLNTTSGDIAIDAITFEREDRLLNYAANNVKAIANNDVITISGTLKDEYVGKTITLLQTEITNYNELINWSNNKVLKTFEARSKEFSFTIPFMQQDQKNMTHLSTVFLAVASDNENYLSGTKLSKAFMIDNFDDFADNPYSFEIEGNTTVKVTDFGAKGDAFTNDNQAIQDAIDYVASKGGGTVIVEGDESNTYGRRYIMTNIELADNICLRIEKGAILWQSQRIDEYHYDGYEPVTSHNIDIEGAAWSHSAPTWNRPFIYTAHCKNVKINGGGTVRMADPGTDCLDGNRYDWDNDITHNCGQFVHEHPISCVYSENYEVKDITIARNPIWTMQAYSCKNVYLGNIKTIETSCINGDGYGFASTSNVVIERCTLYSNDDAIIVSTCYYDPRNDASICSHAWYVTEKSNKDISTHDVTIRHNNVFGGHGLTFIPWGSEDPNESNVEIYNITAYDNVLGGTSTSVGVWGDNPYYGTSGLGTYNQIEANDYSPMRDIFLYDNIYTQDCVLATWRGGTEYQATNIITDCKMNSSSNFINGDFDKDIRFANEVNYVTDLANWSREVEEGASVGTIKLDETLGYSGYIKGNASLYEGLYEIFGSYNVNVKTYLVSGAATLFVKDAISGELLASKEINASSSFVNETLAFNIEKSTTIHVGIIHFGNNDDVMYVDDFEIDKGTDISIYDIDVDPIKFKSTSDFTIYSSNNSNTKIINGSVYTSNNAETKIILNDYSNLEEFVFETDIVCNADNELNAGVYLFANNASSSADCIDAINVQLESKANSNVYQVKMFEFSSNGGYLGGLTNTNDLLIPSSETIHLKIVSKNGVILVFVDNQEDFCLYYELDEEMYGSIGLRSQYQNTSYSNITLKVGKTHELTDLTNLKALLNEAKSINDSLYTSSSYAALRALLNEAYTLNEKSLQSDVDSMILRINEAISNLELKEVEESSGLSEEPSERPSEEISSEETSLTISEEPSSDPTPSKPSKGCKGSTSGLVSLLSILGLCLLSKKRK